MGEGVGAFLLQNDSTDVLYSFSPTHLKHYLINFEFVLQYAKTNSSVTDIKGASRTAATSKMERFVIIVNGFQPLTIITKSSILDVAAVLDPPLDIALCIDIIWCYSGHTSMPCNTPSKSQVFGRFFGIRIRDNIKVNESRYKHCWVTQYFSNEQNLVKKILRKDKYGHNQLRKAF